GHRGGRLPAGGELREGGRFMTAERLPAALVLVAAPTGCGGKPNSPPRSPASEPTVSASAPTVSASEPTVSASGRCPVTAPGGSVPAPSKGFNYGNGSLGVVLWPEGAL